jgi:hypothetical protein
MKFCLHILIAAIFILAGPCAFAQLAIQNIQAHQNRMAIGAENLVILFPERFPHSSTFKHVVRYYFGELHDNVKKMSLAALRERGYSYSEDVKTRLARYDGISLAKMGPEMAQEFIEFRDEFNSIEYEAKSEYLGEIGILPGDPLIAELEELEMVLDPTDVGIFRRKEFGIKNDRPYNGAEQLQKDGRPLSYITLSKFVEDHFDDIFGSVMTEHTGRKSLDKPESPSLKLCYSSFLGARPK